MGKPDFLNQDLSAKQRSDSLMTYLGVGSSAAAYALKKRHPAAIAMGALGLIAGLHGLQGEGNGVQMQQDDAGDWYGVDGERAKIDMVNRVLGD